MNLPRRSLLLAPVALAFAGRPALARKIPLAEISAYLNGLRTAETAFTQINGDGSRSTGRIFIHRPNRMRFEYDPPDEALVLASAGQVAIFDNKSNQPPEQYPMRRTPLSLILAPRVDLNRARMVVGYEDMGTATAVIAQDPEHPEYGRIRLIFADNPVRLTQWVITDEVGSQTTVMLDRLETGKTYPPSTFSINFEMQRRR